MRPYPGKLISSRHACWAIQESTYFPSNDFPPSSKVTVAFSRKEGLPSEWISDSSTAFSKSCVDFSCGLTDEAGENVPCANANRQVRINPFKMDCSNLKVKPFVEIRGAVHISQPS